MTGSMHLNAFAFARPIDSGSPNNSSEESLLNDDSFLLLDDFDALPELPDHDGNDADQPKTRKSRRPPSTAERRATHNAVERARRESLNGRFMDLAAALPSMATVKRPSKSAIVNKSYEFVQTAVQREQALLQENDALRSELNELRARLGMPPHVGAPPATTKGHAKASPRRRQASLASTASASDASPLINASPLSLSGPATPPMTANILTAPLPVISEDLATASSVGSTASATIPQTPTFVQGIPGFPMMDMQYLMALSMQQQQAQSMLKMSGNGNPFAFQPPWNQMPLNVPVSVAPDLTNNWLYA